MFATVQKNRIATFALLSALSAGALAINGCGEHERNSAIPTTAVVRAEGNGPTVSAAVDVPGTAYVFDATDRKLIWSGQVRTGQAVAVNTKDKDVTVDGRVVLQKGVPSGHTYRIFFDPSVGP
jgi:hypothetical protein